MPPRRAQHHPHHGRRHGLLRHRLLRRRDRHAEPRPARRRAALRFTQFYNTARCCPTRASLLTGLYPHQAGVGHMMSDSGHDGYRGRPQPQLRDHRRGAQARRLRHLHGRQVARHPQTAADRGPTGQLAAAARLRPLLRHDPRRRQLFDPEHADPRQHADRTRQRPRVPARAHRTTTPTPSATTPSRFIREHAAEHPGTPFFMLRRLHRRPLADARAARRTSRSTRASTTPATRRSAQARLAKMKQLGIVAPDTETRAAGRRLGARSPTRTGNCAAWRSTPRWSTSMDQGIGRIVAAAQARPASSTTR